MDQTKLPRNVTLIKLSFFLFLGGAAPLAMFLPTIAKQMGYSMSIYGTMITCALIITMIASPIFGYLVDKYRIRKLVFSTGVLVFGIFGFLMTFVPAIPLETNSELRCGNNTYLKIISQFNQLPKCDEEQFLDSKMNGHFFCQLNCQENPFNYDDKSKSLDQYYNNFTRIEKWINSDNYSSNTKEDRHQIDISTEIYFTEHVENTYVFRILSAHINDSPIPSLYCQSQINTNCHVNCSVHLLNELASSPTFKRNVLGLYTFWLFFIVVILLVMSFYVPSAIQSALCLDLLGNMRYLDEMTSQHDCNKRQWIKTLQGLAQGVQCFGGELPFYFLSGWIIQKLGYLKSMSLTLVVVSARMFFYSVILNPAWVLLIEISNGMSFALAEATRMSYAKLICPPDELNSLMGLIGFFLAGGDCAGSLIGGYLYEAFGGERMFKLSSFIVAILCVLHILSGIFSLSKEFKIKDFTPVSTQNEINAKL
ncbi:uncharacterized protein LOC126840886 isoform X3 [Adelges cooleyi]|uniref:uncharacterized protein LOC126840886 isoform X3 n=1 Tax=Adelges cooleyi TaxID=133065 RepID=UPI00217FB884|nr:uncharacterized protein LOC126840886 isoform X3 [Adelges cooleyi]